MRAWCDLCELVAPLDNGECVFCRAYGRRTVLTTAREQVPDTPKPVPLPVARVRARRAPEPPRPLADPLRTLRTFLMGLLVLNGLLVAAAVPLAALFQTAALLLLAVIGLGGAFTTFAIWRLLPGRPAAILYLRSFRHDPRTGRVRVALQRAFGGLRVSGIRDPRRRWPRFLRYAAALLFALRYSTPKYLNLEAGDDWLRRLWRSMGDCRGVVIDVTDLTPHVLTEVRLALHCFGPRRVLFVGDSSRSAEQWRDILRDALGWPPDLTDLHVAVWGDDRPARLLFDARAEAFARKLPDAPVGFRPDAVGLVELKEPLQDPGRVPPDRLWLELLVGTALGWAVSYVLQRVSEGSRIAERNVGWVMIPLTVFWLVQAWHFVLYFRDCGSHAERFFVSATVGLLLSLFPLTTLLLLPAVEKVRGAADRTVAANQLKTLGLAMHNYASDGNDDFPPANAAYLGGAGAPRVSWRVLVLPYLSDPVATRVARQYRPDEPWDSPHNSQFIGQMPKVFRHPKAKDDVPAGHTHYRVFVSPTRPTGPSAIFRDGQLGARIVAITDGTSNTILIAEAADAVPWTKPDDLEYDANKPLPKLGGLLRGGFHAVLADGSPKFFKSSTPETTLRAYITANGGEAIPAD